MRNTDDNAPERPKNSNKDNCTFSQYFSVFTLPSTVIVAMVNLLIDGSFISYFFLVLSTTAINSLLMLV